MWYQIDEGKIGRMGFVQFEKSRTNTLYNVDELQGGLGKTVGIRFDWENGFRKQFQGFYLNTSAISG